MRSVGEPDAIAAGGKERGVGEMVGQVAGKWSEIEMNLLMG